MAAEAANTAPDVLFFGVGDTTLGKVLLARSAKGVRAILLGDDAGELEADLADRFPEATRVENEAMVRDDLAKVVRCVENLWVANWQLWHKSPLWCSLA
jgi:AraC family transcriptional regulator, regulatory protein of adaptative response / methylated-DNA-[protein]-cysteine methyltransferase